MTCTRLNRTTEPTQLQLSATPSSGCTIASERYYSLNGVNYFYIAVTHASALNANSVYTVCTLPWASHNTCVASGYGYTVNVTATGDVQLVPQVQQPAGGKVYIHGVLI